MAATTTFGQGDGSDLLPTRPNKLARALASAIVSFVAAAVVGKILGRRAGFIALLATAAIHEVVEAPVARFIGERLDLMTT